MNKILPNQKFQEGENVILTVSISMFDWNHMKIVTYDSKLHRTLCNKEPKCFWGSQVLSLVLNHSCTTSFSPAVLDFWKWLLVHNRFQLQLLTPSLEWLQKLHSNSSKVGGTSDKYSGPFLPSPTTSVNSEDGLNCSWCLWSMPSKNTGKYTTNG